MNSIPPRRSLVGIPSMGPFRSPVPMRVRQWQQATSAFHFRTISLTDPLVVILSSVLMCLNSFLTSFVLGQYADPTPHEIGQYFGIRKSASNIRRRGSHLRISIGPIWT